MRILLLLCLLSICIKSITQVRVPENADSLLQQLNEAKGAYRAGLLLQLVRITFPRQPDKAMTYAQEALTIYKLDNDENGQVDAMTALANMYRRNNNLTLAYQLDSIGYSLAKKNNYLRGLAMVSLNLVPHYMRSLDYNKALQISREGIDAGEKAELDKRLMANFYLTRGNIYLQLKEPEEASKDVQTAYDIADAIKDENAKQRALQSMSAASRQIGNRVASLDFIIRALKMAEKGQDKQALASLYLSAGNTYTSLGNTHEGLGYYKKAYALQQYITQPPIAMSIVGNISKGFLKLKEYDSASHYSMIRLSLAQKINDTAAIAASYIDIGDLAVENNKYPEAISYYEKALITYAGRKNAIELTRVYNSLAAAYLQIKSFAKAEDYLLKSYSLQSKSIDKNTKRYTDFLLSKVYEETGEMDNAARFRNEYFAMGGQGMDAATELQINQLKNDFELSKKEDALKLAATEKERRELELKEIRYQLWGSVITLLLLLVLTVIIYKNYRHNKKMTELLTQKNERIEMLMRELHHRVKNNLQVIGSVLSLQSIKLTDASAKSAIEEGRARVEAMSLLHQKMYLDDNLRAIDMEEYIVSLTRILADGFGYNHDIVQTRFQMRSKNMDIDVATPLALIINELITNAFKHAFTQIENPELKIELTEDNQKKEIFLTVSDNGKGINLSEVAPASFGLKLIRTFVKQLGANMDIHNNNGSIFTISFKYMQ